ncbi:MAG: PQQ-dependent sugar dehydrogenase [Nitrospirae bacterium]|nr:PQQ-dependent sugar dehydrogenase [Nitrospirota bacterium]
MLTAVLFYGGCGSSSGNGSSSSPLNSVRPFPEIAIAVSASGFSQPIHITHAGDGSGRTFIVEKAGRIKIIKNGAVLQTPFLDISQTVVSAGSEQGLFSIAFPPGYAAKGYFYVAYTAPSAVPNGATVVARYRITADPDIADPASGQIIISVDQPFANHNGGQVAFGPDGFLYVSLGDGGSGGDPFNNGQNLSVLLGKLLRLDVEANPAAAGYSTPASNPFVNTSGARGEIWAYGLRNPWRFSFDRLTGDLFIGDVGQATIEEIDFQTSASKGGENYGWNIMEGSACFQSASCNRTGLVLPVAEYDHAAGDCSVTGGMVYRGAEFNAMKGIYFFGDFCTGKIRAIKKNGTTFESSMLLDTNISITTFGEDEAGELYVADFIAGDVYRISAQ